MVTAIIFFGLSLASWELAAICSAIMDTLKFHYYTSIFYVCVLIIYTSIILSLDRMLHRSIFFCIFIFFVNIYLPIERLCNISLFRVDIYKKNTLTERIILFSFVIHTLYIMYAYRTHTTLVREYMHACTFIYAMRA